jgi:hypothetical protein
MRHSLLILVLGGAEWPAAFPNSFNRWERTLQPIDRWLLRLCSYRQIYVSVTCSFIYLYVVYFSQHGNMLVQEFSFNLWHFCHLM